MKTPHRTKEGVLHFEVLNHIGETIECAAHYQQPLQHARWKRKNRVKQLKATIARLKAENAYLRHEIELIADCLQLKGDKQ